MTLKNFLTMNRWAEILKNNKIIDEWSKELDSKWIRQRRLEYLEFETQKAFYEIEKKRTEFLALDESILEKDLKLPEIQKIL